METCRKRRKHYRVQLRQNPSKILILDSLTWTPLFTLSHILSNWSNTHAQIHTRIHTPHIITYTLSHTHCNMYTRLSNPLTKPHTQTSILFKNNTLKNNLSFLYDVWVQVLHSFKNRITQYFEKSFTSFVSSQIINGISKYMINLTVWQSDSHSFHYGYGSQAKMITKRTDLLTKHPVPK